MTEDNRPRFNFANCVLDARPAQARDKQSPAVAPYPSSAAAGSSSSVRKAWQRVIESLNKRMGC
jgi:hypothetical protein